jgi:hypothetical protein
LPSSYSRYFFLNQEDDQEYYLFLNRGTSEYLVPEHRNIDYILMIRGSVLEETKVDFMQQLKTLPSVQGVYDIDSSTLKSKENFIFY